MKKLNWLALVLLIVLIVIGIATLIGQPIPGVALGLLLLGYFSFINFLPLWSMLITLLGGVILLSARAE